MKKNIIIKFVIWSSVQLCIVLECNTSPNNTYLTLTLKDKNIYIKYTGLILLAESKNKFTL